VVTETRPPFFLRLCVVVGGFVLLVGTVGVVYLFLTAKDTDSAAGRGLVPRVYVTGATNGMDILVNVRWRDGDMDIKVPAEPLKREPGVWMLLDAPTDRTLTIEVVDRSVSPYKLLGRREAELQPGETMTLDLSGEPER
jgi:hypothetical protein